ncbi:hypothetical protein DWZ76_06990, partial [Clostridium sp. AF35-15]
VGRDKQIYEAAGEVEGMKKDAEDSIPKAAVLELIKEMGGCDAGDEFARGWDAACDAFYKTIMERF